MKKIREIHNVSIFDTTCQTIVNTVNCVGVMGKGIALEYKLRFPEMYKEYLEVCKRNELKPGKLLLYKKSKPWILNFPTKKEWKYPAKIEYIKLGLMKLRNTYKNKGITSIAFPKLGTSSGGLEWNEVRKIMYEYLEDLPNLQIEIYHYEKNMKDSLFDTFTQKVHRLSINDYKIYFGINKKQAEKIKKAINKDEVNSMLSFQNLEGIGKKTIEKLYDVALERNNRIVSEMEKENTLF